MQQELPTPEVKTNPKYLRWLGPLLDCSGYSAAGRSYLRAAESANIIIQPRDRSRSINLKDKGMDAEILSMYQRLYVNQIPIDAPTVQHQVPTVFHVDNKSKYPIGYTIFEMCSTPKTWTEPCNRMAAIWTGSEYSKASFLSSGVKVPIHVLPHAIEARYSPEAVPWTIENKRGFCFLSVMDFTERKGWRELLRAYWHAFKKKDDVCLILKAYFGGFDDLAIKDLCRRIHMFRRECNMMDGGPILLYGYDIPADKMPGLYRSADCYVGISREGFGLPFCESMACGLPCIGPEVGGNREYMNEDNSYLIRYAGDEPIATETSRMFPEFAGLRWPKHSWEHLSEIMKKVVQDKEGRQIKAKKGLDFVREKLSDVAIGKVMANLIP